MQSNNWIVWDNPSVIDKTNYTQAIKYAGTTLKIDLVDDTPEDVKITLIFNYPIAYRVTEEICTIALQCITSEQHNHDHSVISKFMWFKIESSSYIQELEGLLLEEKSHLTHFAFFSLDHLIEVISQTEPIIIRR